MSVGVTSATHEEGHVDVEPDNNQISGAVLVDDGCYDGGVTTSFDDYYAVNLTDGELLDASIKFNRSDGDLRVEVLNPDEEVIASGESVANNVATELATITANISGTHYVRVYSADGGTAYSLSVKTGTVRDEVDVEPDNNQISGAILIDDGCYEGGVSTGFDDYYAVNLTDGESLRTSIDFNRQGSEGNLQLEVLNPDGQVIASSESMMDNESVNITANVSGAHYLRIYSAEGGSAYSLSVNTVGGGSDTDDDGSTQSDISISHRNAVRPGGEFEVTVTIPEVATSAVEVYSSDFDATLTVQEDDGDTTNITDSRVEFIDTQADGGNYQLMINVTNSSEGDTGTITAYAGGEADDADNKQSATSTFTVSDLESSPVEGVSDELWTEVTRDGTLSLGDLGTAIQEYRGNGQVNGVDISLGDLGSLIQEYQN
jgi:hypothetical protein